ncbi:MAG TPA: hypothetical protein VGP08_24450, partial [Pyrinomonadaceae bacterium]|nr:hypothetical protein [Pyrinomonadaceae bacterium]
RVLRVMRANGLMILSVTATLLLIGIAVYVLAKRIRSPRKSAMQQVAEAEGMKAEGETGQP